MSNDTNISENIHDYYFLFSKDPRMFELVKRHHLAGGFKAEAGKFPLMENLLNNMFFR